MSVTPGPYARPPSTRNGRSAAVPGSKTVSMCPMSRIAGPAASEPGRRPITVEPSRPAGSGWIVTSAPTSPRNPATNRPTSSTPSGV
jgi:hypothetical protein